MAAKAPTKPAGKSKPRAKANPPPAVKLDAPGGEVAIDPRSAYRPEFDEMAYRLAMLGLTDEEMAQFFGVILTSMYRWDDKHPTFRERRIEGKILADAEIAVKLHHRARGYSHPDVHISNYQGAITETPIEKHYPPDTQAATWWLKNRQRDKWRDKVDIEASGPDGGPIPMSIAVTFVKPT